MKKLLLLLMIVPMIGFGQKKVDRTDAEETTRAILTAYKARDIETISSLSPPDSEEFFNELIEQGKRVVPFEVDRFVSWRQALNLREFEYWEKYYDSVKRHPYRKNKGIIIREDDRVAV